MWVANMRFDITSQDFVKEGSDSLFRGGSNMRLRMPTVVCCTAILSAVGFFTIAFAETTHFNKAQVGDRIRKVGKRRG
jgi:hypothetical protein